jgi:hypothetical protein
MEESPRPHEMEKMEAKEKLQRVYVGPGKNHRVFGDIIGDVVSSMM